MITRVREIVTVSISTITVRDGFWKKKKGGGEMNNYKEHFFLRICF